MFIHDSFAAAQNSPARPHALGCAPRRGKEAAYGLRCMSTYLYVYIYIYIYIYIYLERERYRKIDK